MLRKKKHEGGEEEGGGHSVGLWYVSFSDMITLLLSFFVMLTTFSSYSKESMDKFAGVMDFMASYSIFPGRQENRDSMIPPAERNTITAEKGSEKPTEIQPGGGSPQRTPYVPELDAYAARKSMFIPSEHVFFNTLGTGIPTGQKQLRMIAKFASQVPCELVISECIPPGQEEARRPVSLRRSAAVMEFLVKQGLPADRLSISSESSARFPEPMVEIVLVRTGEAP